MPQLFCQLTLRRNGIPMPFLTAGRGMPAYGPRKASYLLKAGRQGFEPWVQFYPHNRLAGGSDRPLRHLPERSAFKAEGEGFEPPVTTRATAVFKTAALNHSAIPPYS